jgi:lipopolysaccharide transport system ATP-binding protein
MSTVIEVSDLGKLYRLGEIGTGTLGHDLKRWWARTTGKEDPYTKIGQVNDRTRKAEENEYVWAIQDISFKIERGDIVGVIGKNGAGKSTLLKILSRITAPSVGTVKVKGRVASLLEVGTGFHPEMTGRENIYMNGTVLGMRRHEITRKFDEIVDFAGVAKYIDTPVKRYSSGMMVRLGFAVAAFLEPEILIVDEVLAVGDAEFQRKALGKMQDVSRGQGRTVLFVSHNMASIRKLCSKAMLMNKGTLADTGTTDRIIELYLKENQKPSYSKNSIGGIHLKSLVLKTVDGIETQVLKTFERFFIELTVDSSGDYDDVSLAVGFNNVNSARVFSLWTKFLEIPIDLKEGTYKLTFEVNNLRLTPGEYFLTSYIDSKGTELERIDELTNVIVSFTASDSYKFEPKLSQGLYMESFKYNITKI